MTIILKKDATKEEVEQLLKKLKPRKLFNAKKHLGKLKLKIDGVEYQRNQRVNWF